MKNDSNSALLEDTTKPISLKNNILVMESNKELLLYDLERNKAYCLNEMSWMVWNLCNGENTVEDIRRQISIQLKTQVSEEVIWLALHDLKKEELLSNYREININFNGLNRREVIKKIGFTTMTALPLILAVIAPTAVSAQSLVCQPSTACFCSDASCVQLGPVALLQTACVNSNCSGSGGNNCQCVGPFICSNTPGQRLGRCGLI